MNEEHDQIEALLNRALEFKPGERPAFLAGACGGDHELREKVETLLRAADEADGFMEGITTLEETPLSEAPGTVIGRYKLLQKVGEGGMGVVYMAEQTEPVTRKVALKIIKLGMDTKQVVARFEAERQALAMMDHPNIAKVLDAGSTESGRPYFVMELVRGVPITEYCDKNKLPTQERLNLFIPVCQAIQHAHQKGVIHRDIKPSNVMVTLHDGNAVPKVIDFGIAKATNQKLTEKTLFTNYAQMIGTPAYMSPEQAEMSGLDVDTRTDVYSLGVLLYELMTGTTPFPSKELLSMGYGQMQKVIAEKEPPKPSTRLSTMQNEERTVVAKNRSIDVSALGKVFQGDLDCIVMKCLEKDRTRRYETANGLAADIKRHLDSEPVVARPPSTAYRFQKAFRRNKLAFSAATAVGLAVVVGFGVSLWQARRATRQQHRAENSEHKAIELQQMEAQQRKRAVAVTDELRSSLYASEMSAAFASFRAGSIVRCRDLLKQQQESAVSHLRGFEWRLLWEQSRAREKSSLAAAQNEAVSSIDYSPDGQRMLSYSSGGLKVWNTVTRQAMLTNAGGFGYYAEFSKDGRYMVSTDYGGENLAKLWDGKTGAFITNFSGNTLGLICATLSPDSRLMAAVGSWFYGDDDAEILIWDVGLHQQQRSLRERGSKSAGLAQFSPDGLQLAAGYRDGRIRIWDVASGRVVTTMTGHRGFVTSVSFDPRGTRLVSTGLDRTVRLWDVKTGQEISLLGLHEKGAWRARFSPNGIWVVSVGWDHLVKIWKPDEAGWVRTFRGHQTRVAGIAFDPNGSGFATSDLNGVVRFWDLPSIPDEWILDQPEESSSFGFAKGRRLLLGLVGSGHVSVLDVASKRQLLQVDGDGPVWVPGAERFVFIRQRDLVEVDVATKTETVLGSAAEDDQDLRRLAISNNGKLLALGHQDHTHVFDRIGRREIVRLDTGTDHVNELAFSPDDSLLAAAGPGASVQLWDARSWNNARLLEGHTAAIYSISFSSYGKLASSSYDGTVRVRDLSGADEWVLKDDEGDPMHVAFSPDGRTLAVGTFDGAIKLWHVASRQQITTFEAGASIVRSLMFDREGTALTSTTFDRQIRVWQAPSWAEIEAIESRQNK